MLLEKVEENMLLDKVTKVLKNVFLVQMAFKGDVSSYMCNIYLPIWD